VSSATVDQPSLDLAPGTQSVKPSAQQTITKRNSIPAALKEALVCPLLKKVGLDGSDQKSFRPVSNLPFLSKLFGESCTG